MEQVKVSEFKQQQQDDVDLGNEQVDEQQCQELINRLSNCLQPNSILEEPQENEEPINEEVQKQKSRLEKEYLDLCVQIQRQQKQLDNYKFKIKVSNKEAQYYSRQIKEKQQILSNLEQHQGSAKKAQKTTRR